MVVHFVHACGHREFYKFSVFKKEMEVPRWRNGILRRSARSSGLFIGASQWSIFGGPGKKKPRPKNNTQEQSIKVTHVLLHFQIVYVFKREA